MRNAFGKRKTECGFCNSTESSNQRRHSEGGVSRPKNPPPFERVESLNFRKSEFTQIPFSVFRTPFSVSRPKNPPPGKGGKSQICFFVNF